jgi:hypothetical protein
LESGHLFYFFLLFQKPAQILDKFLRPPKCKNGVFIFDFTFSLFLQEPHGSFPLTSYVKNKNSTPYRPYRYRLYENRNEWCPSPITKVMCGVWSEAPIGNRTTFKLLVEATLLSMRF